MSRLVAFYHIYCNPHTPNVVHDQITKLVFSGCYEALDSIYCFLAGSDSRLLQLIKGILQSAGSKFTVVIESLGDTRYERLTLESIQSMITADDKLLYFHSKGITNPANPCIYHWRTMLEFHCFTRWKKAVALLDSYDTVGCNLMPPPKPHYSGNFWWATGSYLLRLPPTIGPDYLDPEFWIGLCQPKAFDFFSSNINHYREPFPLRKYVDLKEKIETESLASNSTPNEQCQQDHGTTDGCSGARIGDVGQVSEDARTASPEETTLPTPGSASPSQGM